MTNEEIRNRASALMDALECLSHEGDPDEIDKGILNITHSVKNLFNKADGDCNRGKIEMWLELLHQVNLELWDGILNLDFKKITNSYVHLTQLERSMQ